MAKQKGEATAIQAQVAEMKTQADALLDKLTPKPEAKPEETPKAPEAKVEEKPAQQDLQTQLESLTKELEKAREEAKAHQRNVSKKDEEVQKFQAKATEVEAMRQGLDILTQMVADMMDNQSSEDLEEKPKQRRSEAYLKRLDEETKKTQEAQQTTVQREHQRIIDEVVTQLQSVGLQASAMDTDEFITAKVKFLERKPLEGLEEVKKVVKAKTEAHKETDEEKFERMYNERRKKEMKEKGELNAETGQPTGTAGTKFSIESLRNYSAKGKDIKDLVKDRDALLDQFTK